MAASNPDTLGRQPRSTRVAFAAALALVLAMPVIAAQPTKSRNAEIVVDAASSDVDYRSNTLLFRDVVITQAERARATGLDFKDATWTFSGKVKIDVEGGTMRAEEAVVNFIADQLARATVRGKPAEFEQQLQTGGTARGRAGSLVYETRGGTVTLKENAWLSDGRSEIRGQQLVYEIAAQRVQAGKSTGSDERVRIVIRPQTAPEPKVTP